MNAIPARRRLCCTRFVPAHQRPRSASAGGGEDACTQAGSLRYGERLQPGLTQRDIWVMHREQHWEHAPPSRSGKSTGSARLWRAPLMWQKGHCAYRRPDPAPRYPGSACLRRAPLNDVLRAVSSPLDRERVPPAHTAPPATSLHPGKRPTETTYLSPAKDSTFW